MRHAKAPVSLPVITGLAACHRGMAMITCMMRIRVQDGHEQEAIDTLAAIERHARQDGGLVNFAWLRDARDIGSFTLFEQWDTQDDLDHHRERDVSRWERFLPCLVQEPVAETFQAISDLAGAPRPDEVRPLVHRWLTRLCAHDPVEELLPMLAPDGLVMEFPGATLTSEADFRTWYHQQGSAYHGQSYRLQRLEITEVFGSAAVDLNLIVLWKACRAGDGAGLALRTRQSWQLERCATTGLPLIARYQVGEMTEISVAVPSVPGPRARRLLTEPVTPSP